MQDAWCIYVYDMRFPAKTIYYKVEVRNVDILLRATDRSGLLDFLQCCIVYRHIGWLRRRHNIPFFAVYRLPFLHGPWVRRLSGPCAMRLRNDGDCRLWSSKQMRWAYWWQVVLCVFLFWHSLGSRADHRRWKFEWSLRTTGFPACSLIIQFYGLWTVGSHSELMRERIPATRLIKNQTNTIHIIHVYVVCSM